VTAAIETSGLCKNYRPIRAVIDLDLVVEQGRVFAFLGPNRGGKAAIVLLAQDVAAQEGPRGIGVNCLAPETILIARNLAVGITIGRICPRLPRA